MGMNIFPTCIPSTNTNLTSTMTPVICSEQRVFVQALPNTIFSTRVKLFSKSGPFKESFCLKTNQLTQPHVDTTSWLNLNATAKRLAASTKHSRRSWWLINKNVLHMVHQQIQGP